MSDGLTSLRGVVTEQRTVSPWQIHATPMRERGKALDYSDVQKAPGGAR
jgi:hypothetical protein